jgi:hypothetical protein
MRMEAAAESVTAGRGRFRVIGPPPPPSVGSGPSGRREVRVPGRAGSLVLDCATWTASGPAGVADMLREVSRAAGSYAAASHRESPGSFGTVPSTSSVIRTRSNLDRSNGTLTTVTPGPGAKVPAKTASTPSESQMP